jgi:mutator protein MutT
MKTIKVTGAIIRNDNNFLIGRRGKNEKSGGMWEFPGGKLNEGESLKECIKRELKEELNIDAEIGELFFSYTYNYPHVSYELYFFKVNSFLGVPAKCVHDKLKWEKLKNFYKYDFLPGDGPLIDKLVNEANKDY